MMTQLTLLTMLFIDRWVDILGYYPPPPPRSEKIHSDIRYSKDKRVKI